MLKIIFARVETIKRAIALVGAEQTKLAILQHTIVKILVKKIL